MQLQTCVRIEESDLNLQRYGKYDWVPGVICSMELHDHQLKVEYFSEIQEVGKNRFNFTMSIMKNGSGNSWTWLRRDVIVPVILNEINNRLGEYRVCPECGGFDHQSDFRRVPEGWPEGPSAVCFQCHFWMERYQLDRESPWYRALVIDGTHYTCNPGTNNKSAFLGFGGRHHKIRLLGTDDAVETNDLWSQSKIPDRFLFYFPDNAEFV